MADLNPEAIGGSSITWDILKKDFQAVFNSTAKIGPNRRWQRIGEGNGCISEIFLATFDWQGDSVGLPEKACIKITNSNRLAAIGSSPGVNLDDAVENARAANDNELYFFENARDKWRYPAELRIPKFYCGRKLGVDGLDAGYFAIEHFNDVVTRHLYHEIQESAILDVLEQLSIVNGHSIRYPELYAEITGDNHKTMMAEFLTFEALSKILDAVAEEFPDIKEELEELRAVTKMFESWEGYQEKVFAACHHHRIFIHGDLWLGNMLWRKEENGDYTMVSLIDWQVSRIGNPHEDIVRLLACAQTTEDYDKKKTAQLHYYYDKLREYSGDAPFPWKDFQDFMDTYEHSYVHMTCKFTPMLLNLRKMLMSNLAEGPAKVAYEASVTSKLKHMVTESSRLIRKWNLTA
ncbi:unnamed protein product, partial [Mesorhabditis spiculigera]